ncbi:MAG: SpaA isopeptide-forming pilin-related protein, partial [Planctomycetota bacterium]|nr:SpaA isopeptide-forming pilin-related protein [Planctomycetota bacterium]
FVWSGNGRTNQSGAISDTIASLAPLATVVYTVTATVDPTATAQLVNTVTVTAANDTNPANNTAIDKDNLTPQNDVSVTKVDSKGGSSITNNTGAVVAGSSFTYTITVSNSGPSTATSVAVSDPVPAGLTSFVWSGNGKTNQPGPLADTIASLASGGNVVYTVTATVGASATAQLVNTVTVTAANDTNANNNSAVNKTDIDASIAGVVYLDNNRNGRKDTGDSILAGITVTLTGTDGQGNAVNRTTTTDATGAFLFDRLKVGSYTITEGGTPNYQDGKDTIGTLAASTATKNSFANINLDGGVAAKGYLFGEMPLFFSKRAFLGSTYQ